MPPKPPSKNLEEVLNNIQAHLMVIQSQLEDNTSRQSTLEAKNDHFHSTFMSLLDQVVLLSHPKNKLPPWTTTTTLIPLNLTPTINNLPPLH